jgi:putative ABC transport system permease protein
MLGVQPSLGRDFLPEEGSVGGPHVVILSNGFWRTNFAARRDVLGQSITLDSQPYTIVGVLPANFALPGWAKTELWFPLQIPATSNNPSNGGMVCFGSLKPGVTRTQAEAALTPTLEELRKEFPKMFAPNERAHLVQFRDFLNQWAGSAPLLLLGAVGLVLLIACVNVANLTLARSAARQREMAVRSALGARRGRLARQLLTESVLLASFGGILGVFVCFASFQFILTLVPSDTPRVGTIGIDASVLAFAALLSFASGIIFGLAPALRASRVDLNASLKESTMQSGAGRSGRLRGILASGEVAISLVLLIAAALTLETLARLTSVKPGFDPNNLLTFQIQLTPNRYPTPASRSAFFGQAVSRVAALPGVEQAALIDSLPLVGGPDIIFTIVGDSARPGEPLAASFRVISPDYFRALRIPLENGRVFAPSDNTSNVPVVVINHAMAEMFFAGQNPIGRSIWIGKGMGPTISEPAPRQIIGVVGDIRESTLAQPASPTMFFPFSQTKWNEAFYFVVRTRHAPMLTLPDARAALHAIDAGIPLVQPETMQSVIADSLTQQRFDAILLGIFGTLALLIAAIGVYGVISYSMERRTHEIGIRLALGGQHKDVLRMVLGQGGKIALAGIAIGLAAAFGLTRLIASILYGVRATDPVTYAGVAILLMLVAVAASYIPARRATRVDPLVALRYE